MMSVLQYTPNVNLLQSPLYLARSFAVDSLCLTCWTLISAFAFSILNLRLALLLAYRLRRRARATATFEGVVVMESAEERMEALSVDRVASFAVEPLVRFVQCRRNDKIGRPAALFYFEG